MVLRMISKHTSMFRELFAALPEQVRCDADAAYRRFKANPEHPSLRFHRVQARESVYSIRVGLHYRALALRQPDCWLWFWIGTHADYDKLLN
jgi:hypothetical protein